MSRLIDADLLNEQLSTLLSNYLMMKNFQADCAIRESIFAVKHAPTVDAVQIEAYEQCAWERDIAVQQLLGKLKKYEEEYSAIHWHKVTTRPLTDEETAYYAEMGIDGIEYIFDCEMPDDGQEILIATKWGTDKDICSNDAYYGIGLEGRGDWDGVFAWAKMPEYKDGVECD